jgi:hypothetical protein
MKTGIVFLCKEIKDSTLNFANAIAEKKFAEVYIVSDEQVEFFDSSDMNFVANKTHSATTLFVRDNACIKDGYAGCNNSNTHIKKEVIAYDKFLWIFCKRNLDNLDNIWVFEDDCFIPSIDALINLNNKYKNFDLVTPNNFLKTDTIPDWHWKHIFGSIKKPYYYSMVCAAMFSKKMLSEIKKYAEKNNKLFFIESMFNTIAMQKELKVTDANELKSIVWMGEWDLNHFVQLPNNIFHPIKELDKHNQYRKDILTAKETGFKLTKELPNFLK